MPSWLMNHKGKIYPIIFFAFAYFQILFSGGIIYGWATVVPVFKAEGFFNDLCKGSRFTITHNSSYFRNSSLSSINKTTGNVRPEAKGCAAQRERLNLVFNVAAFSVASSSLPVGVFIDKFGPRISVMFGCIIYVFAGVGMIVLSKGIENILFPTFIFFSLGGILHAVPLYQTANIVFGRFKSLAMCILNGAFDSSSIILVIFKVAYDSGISLQNISIFYSSTSLISVLILVIFFIPPKNKLMSFHHTGSQSSPSKDIFCDDIGKRLADYSAKVTSQNNSTDPRTTLLLDTEIEENTVTLGDMADFEPANKEEQCFAADKFPETLKKSFFSLICILQFIYLTILQLRLWFFIGSLNNYLNLVLDGNTKAVGNYLEIFGYIQLGGTPVATIIGLLFDRNMIGRKVDKKTISSRRHKLRAAVLPVALTNILGLLLSILSIMKSTKALIPLFVLVVFMRGFLYASNATIVGIAHKPQYFGRVFGAIMFFSGLFGLLQFPCAVISEKYFDSNPYWINVAMLILVILANILPIYLWRYTRITKKSLAVKLNIKKERILKENEHE